MAKMCFTQSGDDISKPVFGQPARQIGAQHAALAGNYENKAFIAGAGTREKALKRGVGAFFS